MAGCNNNKIHNSTDQNTSVTSEQDTIETEITEENESTPNDYSQISNLPDIYQQVLDNKKSFTLRGDEVYIDEYKSPYLQKQLSTCDCVEYGVLDMDRNGDVELLIKGWSEDILVLHIENDVIYGYDFTFRGMYNVAADGSFCWNTNSGNTYGVSKLVFKNQEFELIEIYRIENDNTYFVNNTEVCKEEFDLFITNRKNVNQITWYDMATYPKEIDGKALYKDWDLPECAIYQDNNGEFFVHIKAWNIYRKIDLSSIKWEDGYGPFLKINGVCVNDSSTTIAIYNYDRHYGYVTIYHFNRGNQEVKAYSKQVEAYSFYECGSFDINVIDEETVYFFVFAEPYGEYPYSKIQFVRFETFDGGKSWSDPQIISSCFGDKTHCKQLEFFTKDLGYCISGHGDMFSILQTTDGGVTWNDPPITFPSYTDEIMGYVEFISIEMTEKGYVLKIKVYPKHTIDIPSYDLYYITNDFMEWRLIDDPYEKFQLEVELNICDKWLDKKLSEGVEAPKNIYADYLKIWKDEMTYAIEKAEKLFDDHNEYEKWKTDLEQWMYYSSEILKREMNSFMGTMDQLEVIIPHCELVRQKVIDTKYFLYKLELFKLQWEYPDSADEFIDIKWYHFHISYIP